MDTIVLHVKVGNLPKDMADAKLESERARIQAIMPEKRIVALPSDHTDLYVLPA